MSQELDYWTQNGSALDTPNAPTLGRRLLKNVAPLDGQFGAEKPKPVPDELREIIFGSLEVEGAKPAKSSAVQTYAILDAARIRNVVEILETSGLEHRCLFKGEALEEFKDVAPWVVKIEEGHNFTRNLFTQSDAPQHLWGRDPGIFIRSGASLDEIWSHFRKFTRARDADGNLLYLRFYSAVYLPAYLGALACEKRGRFFGPTDALICQTREGWHVFTQSFSSSNGSASGNGN